MATIHSTISSRSTTSDFVLVAIAYAEEALADRKGKRFGQWIRCAAKRFLKDLKRAQRRRSPPFLFSPARANHACQFIEQLPHVEGRWESATIKLEPFQVFFIVQLFGFRSLNGGRRFTAALFAIARKNAKTTLAAAILLYILCCELELGAQIYTAATTGAQARIPFGIARAMVMRLSALQRKFNVEAFANALARYDTLATFKPINAKASTQDGLNPSAVGLDELHAHKTHDLKNVLTSAAGARDNPLFLYTTTEGYESPGPWPEERQFAQNVLQGVIEAEHYLALIFSVDDEDDEFDEKIWIKANPLLPVNPKLLAAIRRDAAEAKQKPGSHAEFRIKRLNRRAETSRGWIRLAKWRACGGTVDLKALQGQRCWASFDLATTTDMNAWRLLWQVEDRFYTWGRYWVPEDAVKQRTERKTTPYAAWVGAGYIEQTPGDVTDYERIKQCILEDCERFAPIGIGYDPFEATQLANELTAAGLPLQTFHQGTVTYNPAMKAFERAYIAGKVTHDHNPVLTWNFANLVVRTDANGNLAPDRKKSADKIDGAVSLIMDFGLAAAASTDDLNGFISNPVIATAA